MGILILGLALFLAPHLLPIVPSLRDRLRAALGENRYKALFSLSSALGLVLIVYGYGQAPRGAQLFAPSRGAIAIAPAAMALSFILLASANMKTRIRRYLGHPMLLGVGLWSAVHLLANGSSKATLLFGAFLAYAVIDLISAISRHAVKSFEPKPVHDVIAVASGIGLALLVMFFHRPIFGAQAVGWGM